MDELIEALKEAGLTEQEAIEKISSVAGKLVEAERTKGIEKYREKDNEAKKLRDGNKTAEMTVSQLNENLKKLMADLELEKTARAEESTKAKKSTVRAELASALSGKIRTGASKLAVSAIMAENEVDIVDGIPVVGGIPVSKFAEKFISENPDIQIAIQTGGTGNPPANTVSKSLNEMSLDEILKS